MKCYMCDVEGTTREHVPPRAIFPADKRTALVTVPSCPLHNHSQSLDVEYVRNIITLSMGINAAGVGHLDVTKRSFENSPKLLRQTLKDFETILVKGQETGIFKGDLVRMGIVMTAIANALYFKEYGVSYPSRWKVFITSLTTQQEFETGISGWERFVDFMMRIQFKTRDVPYPEIFRYGVFEMVGGIAFEFVFYDGFFVHCWGPT